MEKANVDENEGRRNKDKMRHETWGEDHYVVYQMEELMQMGLTHEQALRLVREMERMRRYEIRFWKRVRENELIVEDWGYLLKAGKGLTSP